jgi:polyhydroxybutyrate depolymerase
VSAVSRATLLLLLFAAACTQRKSAPTSDPATAQAAGAPSSNPAREPAPPATAPDTAGTASARPGGGTSNLGLGRATVHVPAGLGPGEKAPLVVILHGLGASSELIDRYSDFSGFAQARRIAWIAPDGPKDGQGRQFWNAGKTCCNFDGIPVDHVAALRALITLATREHPIDPKRVYVVGYSNGGFMAHRLGCELSGLVFGIVSVAGSGVPSDEPCPSKGPLRVLEVHGDADNVVNIAGGPLFADPKYPSSLPAQRTVSDWARRLGCETAPKRAGTLDFESRVAGAETEVSRFEGCTGGALELWTVRGGGHYVGLRSPSYELMWKFLSES